jgi:hypothetical protein
MSKTTVVRTTRVRVPDVSGKKEDIGALLFNLSHVDNDHIRHRV